MHAFLSNLANTQTDERGQTHLPPLSEVTTIQNFSSYKYINQRVMCTITDTNMEYDGMILTSLGNLHVN